MLTVRSATASDTLIHIIPTTIIVTIINLLCWCGILYFIVLIVKALRKYIASGEVRKEASSVRKSLGEALKDHRIQCNMTQEFVAEHLGVSRQAVSKWETGASDPSTSNLLALAKLYGINAADLLKEVQDI